MLKRIHQFRRWAGVDRAVFFSNAAQLLRLITGPMTMALVVRYLTPEVQGYFYAFSGVVAMQVFLEMGFSQNILQFASHEFAKLQISPSGRLGGDEVAKSRLISLGRLAFGYYAIAAAVFLVGIGTGGQVFFTLSKAHHPEASPIAWQGAWWIIAATAALSLAINPAWALLEGCGQIAKVGQFRFWSSLAAFAVNAGLLIGGAGIYAAAFGSLAAVALSVSHLAWRWRTFFLQFLQLPQCGEISWRREIWPFQWRIAISWMSGYLIFDMISPVAFYFCGAAEAGRLGFSLQITRMIFNVAMSWINTKAPRFGTLIAAKSWQELDILWRRSTLQSFLFCLLGMSAFLLSIPYIDLILPKTTTRLAPFPVNFWLSLAMLVQLLVSSMAIELRAHKREPYMWLSVGGALLTSLLMLLLVRHWGIVGQAAGFMMATGAGLVPAWLIYRVKRLEYRHITAPTDNELF